MSGGVQFQLQKNISHKDKRNLVQCGIKDDILIPIKRIGGYCPYIRFRDIRSERIYQGIYIFSVRPDEMRMNMPPDGFATGCPCRFRYLTELSL